MQLPHPQTVLLETPFDQSNLNKHTLVSSLFFQQGQLSRKGIGGVNLNKRNAASIPDSLQWNKNYTWLCNGT